LGLWCLTPLSTIFQLYRGGQFYWWSKPWILGENRRPAARHWQTCSYNVVSSTPRLSGIRTHNVSSDKHWLHRYFEIQLLYDHDHDGPGLIWWSWLFSIFKLSTVSQFTTSSEIEFQSLVVRDTNEFLKNVSVHRKLFNLFTVWWYCWSRVVVNKNCHQVVHNSKNNRTSHCSLRLSLSAFHQGLQMKFCKAEQDCFWAPWTDWDFSQNWGFDVQ
jgi:hypothetical protein